VADEPDKLSKLREYQALVKQVMAIADKDTVEEVARVLAAHIGYYERRYGQVPMEETLASLHAEAPTDEQIADLAVGMQKLVAVLLLATGVADDQAGKA
jgi:hypothetical protein